MMRTAPFLVTAAVALVLVAGPRIHAAEEPLADPFLTRAVSLEARHVPLDDVLRRIGSDAGVTLHAEGSAADLRCTAFVTRQPAGLVLRRLAVAFHLTWRAVDGKTPGEYVLYETEQDQEAAVRAREREWELFRDHVRNVLQANARGEDAGGLTDPLTQSAQLVVSLPEGLLERALRGETVIVPYDQLPPAARDAYLRRRAAAHQLAVKLYVPGNTTRLPGGGVVRVGPPQPPVQPELTGLSLSINRDWGDGQWALFSVGEVTRNGPAGSVMMPAAPKWADRLRTPCNFGERTVHASLPLHLKLSRPSAREEWEEALSRFAKENSLSIVSDAYDPSEDDMLRGLLVPPAEGSGPAVVLDRLCVPYDYTWDASQPVVALRRRDWALVRERAIPERLARHWRQLASEQGSYTLDDLALMASLNAGQRGKLERYAGKDATSTVLRHQESLMIYHALNASQRARARGSGLPVSDLLVSQRAAVARLTLAKRPEAVALAQSLKQIEAADQPEKATATLSLLFRDGHHITEVLDCKARPLQDPWKRFGAVVVRLPDPKNQR